MKKLNELGPVKVDHRHRVSSSAGQLVRFHVLSHNAVLHDSRLS